MPRPCPESVLTVAPEPVSALCEPRPWPGLKCLCCGEEGTVCVTLGTMEIYCSSCETELPYAEVRARVDAWAGLLAWLSLSPGCPGPGEGE